MNKIKWHKINWAEEKKKINKEEIDWDYDYSDLLEKDVDERMEVYAIEGTGKDTGKKYQGSAVYCCGELVEIQDIEEI